MEKRVILMTAMKELKVHEVKMFLNRTFQID